MHRAMMWEKLNGDRVRCFLCSHHCKIPTGGRGICQVRENREGILYTLVIGAMPSLKHFGFGFLASQAWDPAFMEFGALSSVYGTLVSTAIGMLIAVPLSLVIALFLVTVGLVTPASALRVEH